MKKTFLTLFLSVWALTIAHAQEPTPLPAKSQITDVTVFLSGAQVSEEATIALVKGDNIVVFEGLATNIDARSIQAAAPDIVLINSVRHEVNFMKEQVQTPRIIRLQDSLRLIQEKTEVLINEKTVLTQENALVLANQSLSGEQKGVSTDELRKAADFFRTRLRDINERLLQNQRAQTKLAEDRNRITQQLQELNFEKNKPSNDIVVKLKCDYARTVKVGIRYFVPDAGWAPSYDLRAKDTESPITLDYRADVWQTTGVQWNNVNLTLSSGDPLQGGTKPELVQWNLSFGQPGYAIYDKIVAGKMDAAGQVNEYSGGQPGREQERTTTLADYTTMRNTATTAEFAISVKQDVPSDGKHQQVSVQSATLPALFEHYAVPKLDKDAFLIARITGWESLNLLPGNVNIFFEGTYITAAYLDPTYTTDTLDFSLGRDKKVIIERNMLKDYNAKKDIGTNRERTFGYEFVVRNTKKSVVHLKLMDQVPVSQDESIEVKDIDISGAKKDEATGLLTWELELQPAATQKFKLIYSVKHPKKKVVPGI
ncbi:MAG: hypothetical protein RLZZ519_1737 [Bacteroidota bacterium]|jgi:uncharacterized protein (TIGR02231 family)